jgi:hypothetical protein
MTSNLPQREAVARIIDPDAFVQFANGNWKFPEWRRDFALSKADQIISSLQDRWRPPEGWRDHVTDTVHQVAKRTSEEGYSVAIMREGIEAIISSLKGSDVGEVGE